MEQTVHTTLTILSSSHKQTNKCRQTEWQTDKIKQTQYITNYMEHSCFWETNRTSASQETPCILWNQKIYYQAPKNPSSYLISLRSILVSSSHLCFLPRSKFPSGFHSVCHMPCQVMHQCISFLSECQCTIFFFSNFCCHFSSCGWCFT